MDRPEAHRSVILFTRYPQKGRVKTRLETRLGQDQVLGLYRCFVKDVLATLLKSGYPVSVGFLPGDREEQMSAWLGPGPTYIPQKGVDLGQRMYHAFEQVFTAASPPVDQALLVGSDIPDMDQGILDLAFDALAHSDAVLGPAVDGGYYLIGFKRHALTGDVFTGIRWGGEQVFAKTMHKLQQAGLTVAVLPEQRDIDTYDDLEAFYRRARKTGLTQLSTVDFLRTIFSRNTR